jgi:Carboxypeptidase regulatory-like domain/TonB dependent receptor
MKSFVRGLVLLGAVLALPAMAFAQDAVLTGTITDSTGAVLPGVTVTAVNEATGNNYETVSDAAGVYRIPVRVGSYKINANLAGFGDVMRTGVQMLVGQTITLNLQMAPSNLQETVTVTGEAPLIETQSSELGGNIDPRQVQDLPTAGRNWMSLALLAPGNRTNAQGALPVQDRGDVREFQLNVDGLQVTANLGTGNQARYSQDAIAEFQFISNRFDATQGRSSGVQVNAVTKSGTNNLTGTFVGNFRDSRWNADDPVLGTKVPYKNQQYSGTIGGPIVLNKLHYFGNYEFEHQPLTSIWSFPQFPAFNTTLTGTHHVNLAGGRADYELTSRMRLMGKVNHSDLVDPFGTGNSNYPAATARNEEHSNDVLGEFTQVLSNRAVNAVRVGYAAYGINQSSLTSWSNHWQAANGITNGGPNLTFVGFRSNRNANIPRYRDQGTYTFHDDFTFSYDVGGHHDLKAGGEFLHLLDNTRNCNQCGGTATVNRSALPAATLQALLPDPFNADTWKLADPALGAVATRYSVGVSDSSNFLTPVKMWKYAGWAQDDWKVGEKLTLNLGLRYDLIWNAFAQNVTFLPFELANRPQDANNLQPRLGFAYTLTDRMVLRGGAGLYYNDELNTNVLWPMSPLTIAVIAVDNTPIRSDFVANPFNGPLPTYDQALARFCNAGGGRPDNPAYTAWAASGFQGPAPCLLRDLQEQAPIPDYSHVTHSWQSSIGIAQQFGSTTALQVDYVQTNSRNEKSIQDNINLTFNPATGVPYPYSDVAHRAYPMFGVVGAIPHTGSSDYYGVQSSLTKRLSNRWQASATYTLGWLYDRDARPLSGLQQYTGTVPADLGGERSLAATDQRHRVVLNGIYDVGHGFQVSGIYFYGSGLRDQILCGCDARGLQITSIDRLRSANDTQGPAGSIIPRNSFVGSPIHRVEMRLLQRIPLAGRANLAGSLEVFNLFNRKNYGAYDLVETSGTFLKPQQSTNLSYAPRTVQLGFRLTF